jgi:hypothetical protein
MVANLVGIILIPGRVQSKFGTPEFERWRACASRAVLDQIERPPLFPEQLLAVQLDIYYAYDGEITADNLADHRIPRITAAAEAILIALSGLLYRRRNQIERLVMRRMIRHPDELIAEYGAVWRAGGFCVKWDVCQG